MNQVPGEGRKKTYGKRGRFSWCVIGLRDGPDEPCPVEYCVHQVEGACLFATAGETPELIRQGELF